MITLLVDNKVYLARAVSEGKDHSEGFQLWRSQQPQDSLDLSSKFAPVAINKAGKEVFGPGHKKNKKTELTAHVYPFRVLVAKFDAKDGQIPAAVWLYIQNNLGHRVSGGRLPLDTQPIS